MKRKRRLRCTYSGVGRQRIGEWSSDTSLEGHIRLRRRADIGRAGPDEPIVVLLLDHVRAPAGDARAHEDRRVEVAWNPYQEVGHGGVEIQIGIEAFL